MATQYVLVQCNTCKKWYVIPIETARKMGVAWEHLYVAEEMLKHECERTHHRGRRRASK